MSIRLVTRGNNFTSYGLLSMEGLRVTVGNVQSRVNITRLYLANMDIMFTILSSQLKA